MLNITWEEERFLRLYFFLIILSRMESVCKKCDVGKFLSCSKVKDLMVTVFLY